MRQFLIFVSILVISGVSGHIFFNTLNFSFILALLSSLSLFLILILVNVIIKRWFYISTSQNALKSSKINQNPVHSAIPIHTITSNAPNVEATLQQPVTEIENEKIVKHTSQDENFTDSSELSPTESEKTEQKMQFVDGYSDELLKAYIQNNDISPAEKNQTLSQDNLPEKETKSVSQAPATFQENIIESNDIYKQTDEKIISEIEDLKNRIIQLEKHTKLSEVAPEKMKEHVVNNTAQETIFPQDNKQDDIESKNYVSYIPPDTLTPNTEHSKILNNFRTIAASSPSHNSIGDNDTPKQFFDELSDLMPSIKSDEFTLTNASENSEDINKNTSDSEHHNYFDSNYMTEGNLVKHEKLNTSNEHDTPDSSNIKIEKVENVENVETLQQDEEDNFQSDPNYGHIVEDIRKAIFSSNIEALLQPIIELPSRRINIYESFLRIKDRYGNPIKDETVRAIAQPLGLLPKRDIRAIEMLFTVAEKLIQKGRKTPIIFSPDIEIIRDSEYFDELKDIIDKYYNIAHMLVFEFSQDLYNSMDKLTWHSLKVLARSNIRFSLNNLNDLNIDFRYLATNNFTTIRLSHTDFLHNINSLGGQFLPEDYNDALQRVGLKLIVNNVEDNNTVEILTQKNIHFIQGDFFARPRVVRDDINNR